MPELVSERRRSLEHEIEMNSYSAGYSEGHCGPVDRTLSLENRRVASNDTGSDVARSFMMMRAGFVSLAIVLCSARAWAAGPDDLLFRGQARANVWSVDFTGPLTEDGMSSPPPIRAWAAPANGDEGTQQAPLHTAAIQHSDAYLTRAKIHRYASYASIPLFAAELYLGQSLYNSADPQAHKGAHVLVGTGIIALFGVNTVTGAWNLFGNEGRSDKQDRTIKLVHGLLMMAADVGFVATVATAPHSHRTTIPSQSAKALHRNVAFTSIGLGAAGYTIMFVHNF
jgi:hypothetical protein